MIGESETFSLRRRAAFSSRALKVLSLRSAASDSPCTAPSTSLHEPNMAPVSRLHLLMQDRPKGVACFVPQHCSSQAAHAQPRQAAIIQINSRCHLTTKIRRVLTRNLTDQRSALSPSRMGGPHQPDHRRVLTQLHALDKLAVKHSLHFSFAPSSCAVPN